MMDHESQLTHVDSEGRLRMVDVTQKEVTSREARAEACICMAPNTLGRIVDQSIPKGNVLEAARLAGIMAAKKTAELIPLCHPIQLTEVKIDFQPDQEKGLVWIFSQVKTRDRTGVEMEALVAAAHAALTIYDMCKAIDREMTIQSVRLTFKSGGRSGVYQRSP
jgi:cyclic pyranopterin monophosphate synthase